MPSLPSDPWKTFVLLPSRDASLVIHGEDLEEDFPIPLRIGRGGHEHAEQGGADEDERLAPPPFPQSGEGLAVVRLALLVRLCGKSGDGELGFDEGGHVRLETEGHLGVAEEFAAGFWRESLAFDKRVVG